MTSPHEQLVDAFRRLAKERSVVQDAHGNLSVRLSLASMLVKPSGMAYEEIEVEDLVRVDWELQEKTCPRSRKPSVDAIHHAAFYLRHPKVGAIGHTHSPHVVAFAASLRDIPCLTTEQADYFGGPVYCLPYAGMEGWGKGAAEYVDDPERGALLLGHHGSLIWGRTPAEVVRLAVALEACAQKTLLAMRLGPNSWHTGFDGEEMKKWHERYWGTYGQ